MAELAGYDYRIATVATEDGFAFTKTEADMGLTFFTSTEEHPLYETDDWQLLRETYARLIEFAPEAAPYLKMQRHRRDWSDLPVRAGSAARPSPDR